MADERSEDVSRMIGIGNALGDGTRCIRGGAAPSGERRVVAKKKYVTSALGSDWIDSVIVVDGAS